jgi:hypothetical protein
LVHVFICKPCRRIIAIEVVPPNAGRAINDRRRRMQTKGTARGLAARSGTSSLR